MAKIKIVTELTRRSLMQALLALPALSLFRAQSAQDPAPHPDDIVEVNGWILKRSDLA